MTNLLDQLPDLADPEPEPEMAADIERYLASRTDLAASSITAHRGRLTKMARDLDRSPVEVTDDALIGWLSARQAELSAATINADVASMRGFFGWLAEQGEIDADPTTKLCRQRMPPPKPRCLTRADVAAVIDAAPDARCRLIVLLAVQLGLRRGEIKRLRITDVDEHALTLDVRGKGYRGEVSRRVPLVAEVAAALRDYLAASPASSGPLIRRRSGDGGITERRVSAIVGAAMRDAGVKRRGLDGISLHALRHTCAQDLVDGGADMRVAQALLGHSSLATTETYVRRGPSLAEHVEGRSYAAEATPPL